MQRFVANRGMHMSFEGIHTVVSGGASGLGLGLTQRIVTQGGKVSVLDINAEQGRQLAEKHPGQIAFYEVDISQAERVHEAVLEASESFGPLKLAVNCAGILGNARLLGKEGPMDAERFAKVMNINLLGAFHLTRSAAWVMQQQKADERNERGVIVHTASIAAFEGQFGQVAYSASKSGVVGMILPAARELARYGIRIMAVAPGMFETPMLDGVSDEIRQQLCASVPFPSRFGRPDEFASLVEHILDNQMLNGSVIRLDGAARLQ
jgi:NAD(P)-dependent dehydrogenase (short-subunit alcohol dehydrogenase family)